MSSIALPAEAGAAAERQHGVVGGNQLVAIGMSRRQIRYRVDVGTMVRVVGDTYRIAGAPATVLSRYMASTLAVVDSALGARAAAHLLGFPRSAPGAPAVITATSRGHRVTGVVIHRSGDLMPRHRSNVMGIPVTTIPRTVIDLASALCVAELERLVGELIAARRVTLECLFDELDLVARRGRSGVRALRSVLLPRLAGILVPESELERAGLEFLRRHGFEDPVVQFAPPWAGQVVARVDMAFVGTRVVVEFDGRRWHDNDAQFELDRVRDQLAAAAGWLVVRITWQQLHNDPYSVAHRLRRILDVRSSGP